MDFKRKGYSMLKFVERMFPGFFEVFLWLFLIGCTVGGGVLGYHLGGRDRFFIAFTGVIIGGFVGLILTIMGGGLVATFLNINANLEKLVNDDLPSEEIKSTVENNKSNHFSETNVNKTEKIKTGYKKCKNCEQMVDTTIYLSCPNCECQEFI